VKVTKNKVGTPFKEATFPLIYGKGVDRIDEISQLAVLSGIIRQTGAWFRYENESGDVVVRNGREMKFQGRQAFIDYLRQDEEFLQELEARIRGVKVEAPDGEPVDEEGYDGIYQE